MRICPALRGAITRCHGGMLPLTSTTWIRRQHFSDGLAAERGQDYAVGGGYAPDQQQETVVDVVEGYGYAFRRNRLGLAGGAGNADAGRDQRGYYVGDDPVDYECGEPDPEAHIFRIYVGGGGYGPAAVGAVFGVGGCGGAAGAAGSSAAVGCRGACGRGRGGGAVEAETVGGAGSAGGIAGSYRSGGRCGPRPTGTPMPQLRQ